jgi:hypothetical protein
MRRRSTSLLFLLILAQAPTGGAHRLATPRMIAHVGAGMPRLRGGAFLQEDKRGFCEETGAWLDNYDLPHEDVRNLTVIFPRDQPHAIVIGAPSLAFGLLTFILKLLDITPADLDFAGKGGWGGVCGACQGFQGRLSEHEQHIENEFLAEDAWLQRQPTVEWVRKTPESHLCGAHMFVRRQTQL